MFERHPAKRAGMMVMFPILDLEQLKLKTGIDDVELLVTIAKALAREAPVCLSKIEHGLVERNENNISVAAHTLKGASRVMMMENVAEAAEMVEMASKRSDFEEVSSELAPLRLHVKEMLQAVEQFIRENESPRVDSQ